MNYRLSIDNGDDLSFRAKSRNLFFQVRGKSFKVYFKIFNLMHSVLSVLHIMGISILRGFSNGREFQELCEMKLLRLQEFDFIKEFYQYLWAFI